MNNYLSGRVKYHLSVSDPVANLRGRGIVRQKSSELETTQMAEKVHGQTWSSQDGLDHGGWNAWFSQCRCWISDPVTHKHSTKVHVTS